jgi:hypothetical protein
MKAKNAHIIFILFIGIFLLLNTTSVLGATYYSRATGNWNTNTTWSNTSGGAAVGVGVFPIAGDIVYIERGFTVTLNANAACANITIGTNTSGANSTLAISNYTLTTTGAIVVGYNASYKGRITFGSGTLKVDGSLTFTASSYTFTPSTGTVEFTKLTGGQTIPALSNYYKLTLNNTSGTNTSGGAITVSNTLTTSSGGAFNVSSNITLATSNIFGNLTINGTATLSASNTLTVKNTGTFNNQSTGTKTFNGAVVVDNGGTWTGSSLTGANTVTLSGAFTNNSTAQTDNSQATYATATNSNTKNFGLGLSVYNLSSNSVNPTHSGTLTVRNSLSTGQFKLGANANLIFLGNTFNSSGDWAQCSNSATLTLGGSNQTLKGTQYACKVVIDNNQTASLSGGVTFNTFITIKSGSTLTDAAQSINLAGGANKLIIESGATLKLTSGNFPNNFSGSSQTGIHANSTLELSGVSKTYSDGNTGWLPYAGNIIISGTTTYNMNSTGTLVISGNLTIGAGCTFAFTNTGNMQIKGNFTNNGTFTAASARVTTFNGTTEQTISGASTFGGVTINNSSATGVVLSSNITIAGALTLTDGIVYTSSSNLLTMASGSSMSSGSDASYVEGPMKKVGNTAFTFAVGKNGIWARLGFTPTTGFDATTEISAEYFYGGTPNSSNLGSGIHNVSTIEYWDITRVSDPSNNANCQITMYFNNLTRSKITGAGLDIRTVHYEGGLWTNKGGAFVNNGDNTGYITSTTALTSFSPETIGSIDGSSPLPIELGLFTAKKETNGIRIEWTTESELDNDYFTVFRSVDGIIWEEIENVNGAGTTTISNTYAIIDNVLQIGTIYYQLKQTDYNGASSFSNIVFVENGNANNQIQVYPTIVEDNHITITHPFKDSNNAIQVTIINSIGNMVYNNLCFSNNSQITQIIPNLSTGIYKVIITHNAISSTHSIIVK